MQITDGARVWTARFAVAIVLLGGGFWIPNAASQFPQGVSDTQPNGESPPTPAQSLAKMVVPDRFEVTLFAGEPDVYQPIAMEFDDRGRLWVAECFSYPDWKFTGHDRIVIFEDVDNDGQFDRRTVFADRLSNVTGLAIGYGGVFACSTPNLIFFPDRNRDDRPDGEPEVLLVGWNDKKNEIGHNVFNGLTWGPDGWLYGGHGILADSYVSRPGEESGAQRINCGIWRYHPVRKTFDVVAHGTTNPWGIDFDERGEAFFTNSVIGHLWHLIPGARYERMYGSHFEPYSYAMIDACSDHLHWGGGHWAESRSGEGMHSLAGGGHAHVGAMIYLGGIWPDEYHGSLLTCNLHGNRINRDTIHPHESGFTARHAADFLMGHDPWFRGISLKLGPDGNVFVSDWSDYGECHDYDGTHRSSGRIYKISYTGQRRWKYEPEDLGSASNARLFQLLMEHPNAWQRRHALRLLQERYHEGYEKLSESPEEWAAAIAADRSQPPLKRLRAMWVRPDDSLISLDEMAAETDGAIQAWLVRFAINSSLPRDLETVLEILRDPGTAPNVRLAVAASLGDGRLAHPADNSTDPEKRWQLAQTLVETLPAKDDPNLVAMTWYAVEPLCAESPQRFLSLFLNSGAKADNTKADFAAKDRRQSTGRMKLVDFAVRRLLDSPQPNPAPIVAAARHVDPAKRLALTRGIHRALRGLKRSPRPDHWFDTFVALQQHPFEATRAEAQSIAWELSVKFREPSAIRALAERIKDPTQPLAAREQASRWLFENLDRKEAEPLLETLIFSSSDDARMLPTLIEAAGKFDSPDSEALLKQFVTGMSRMESELKEKLATQEEATELAEKTRRSIINTVLTRPSRVTWLLDSIEQKQNPPQVIRPADALQIEQLGKPELRKWLHQVWGTARKSSDEKLQQIATWKQRLTPNLLAQADLERGQLVYREHCGKCHRLFGSGGDIGPDLTGSDRRNLDYILQNVIDPSAVVSRNHQLQTFFLSSGRVVTGAIVEVSSQSVTVQTLEKKLTISRSDIEETSTSNVSIMPEGQFEVLSIPEVRDLVGYLRSSGATATGSAELDAK